MQPIQVDDLAKLAVEQGEATETSSSTRTGPEAESLDVVSRPLGEPQDLRAIASQQGPLLSSTLAASSHYSPGLPGYTIKHG